MLKELIKPLYANLRLKYSYVFPFTLEIVNAQSKYLNDYSITKYSHLKCNFNNALIETNFGLFAKRTEEQYIGVVNEPCWKDPYHGWIITGKNVIIQASIPYSNWKETWANHPIPNRFDFHWKSHQIVHLEECISCDMIYHFGNNYMHFYNSFIAQLALLEKYGVNLSLPIIVPEILTKTNFFKQALLLFPKLATLDFIPTERKIIRAKKMYFAKSNPYTIETYGLVSKFLQLNNKAAPTKNIFLNRNPQSYRSLKNNNEVCSILKDRGFTEIITDKMTLKEQIETFQSAQNIVAIHGAGLGNLLFSFPNKVNLLEIFSKKHILPGYYSIIHEMGGNYVPILGEDENKEGQFFLDPNVLKLKLDSWLDEKA